MSVLQSPTTVVNDIDHLIYVLVASQLLGMLFCVNT